MDSGLCSTLTSRLSRSDLERLVTQAVECGKTLELTDVQSCLPERKRQKVIPVCIVEQASLRQGDTGSFAELSSFLHLSIAASLQLRDRFTFALAVCRSFRSLLGVADLWRCVRQGHLYQPNCLTCSCTPLLRLVRLLPNKCVTDLSLLNVGTPSDVKIFFPHVGPLEALALTGSKVTSTVIKLGQKLKAFGSLRTLSMPDTQCKLPQICRVVVANAPRLTSLRVGGWYTPLTIQDILMIAKSSRAHRDGGSSLLSTLHLGGLYANTAIDAVETIALEFPELEELSLSIPPLEEHDPFTFSHASRIAACDEVEPTCNAGPPSMYSLLRGFVRLRVVDISKRVFFFSTHRILGSKERVDASASSVIGSVLRSAPLLERFSYQAHSTLHSKRHSFGAADFFPELHVSAVPRGAPVAQGAASAASSSAAASSSPTTAQWTTVGGRKQVSFLLYTVTFNANLAHSLTRSP